MRFPVRGLLEMPHVAAYNTRGLLNGSVRGVTTDSRAVGKGDLFIALRGERFDGHAFIPAAIKSGAALVIGDAGWAAGFPAVDSLPVIVVEDTAKTLGQIGLAHRRKFDIPVVAVAGSNGKTTTKEMIAAVLAQKFPTLSTAGNLNNHIGVPQTLFRLTARHKIAVIEIGTNHPGEIAYLCDILEPTHGVLSNIGREHLEFFGDVNGVAREEGTLFRRLRNAGTLFVNADDSRVRAKARGAKKAVEYSLNPKRPAAVRGTALGIDSTGCAEIAIEPKRGKKFTVRLAVPGVHAMTNALAAASIGLHFGVPPAKIAKALGNFKAVDKRMEVGRVDGVTILNDTYNANPDSVLSALQTLRAMRTSGKKIVVLADMRELGESAEQEHRGIGAAAAKMKFEYLLTHGPASRWTHEEAAGVRYRVHYDEQEQLGTELAAIVAPGDAVLIKGSRGMKMENVVGALERHLRSSAKAGAAKRTARSR